MGRIRIVKRSGFSGWKQALIYVIAIVVSLLIGAILLLALGADPLKFYRNMITIGLIDNKFAYKNVEGLIKLFTPLLITSIALALSFRMKFWNIGGEGQFTIGAITSSAVALVFGDTLPPVILLIFMVIAGMLSAGIYGVIVALLKVKFGTNETLLTLMLNYVALYLLKFFGETSGAWNVFLNPESARPRFQTFPESAFMPVIKIGKFSLNISLIIAILICVFIFIYLKKTKSGYEISVIGDSISTAKYAGMKVNRIIVRTMFMSACLIGLAGTCYVSTSHTLSTSVTNNVGWTGIVVAWLSKLNTIGIFVTAVLISVLRFGCQVASTEYTALDSNFADLLQGIILFIVLAADFFVRFKIVFSSKAKEEE